MEKYYTTFEIVPIIGLGYHKEVLSNMDDKIEIHNIIILCFKISIYC
jgi:hypothetical protein